MGKMDFLRGHHDWLGGIFYKNLILEVLDLAVHGACTEE